MKTQRKRIKLDVPLTRPLRPIPGAIEFEGTKVRRPIEAPREPFLRAVISVAKSLKRYLPISQRTVHYRLLNKGILINADKPGLPDYIDIPDPARPGKTKKKNIGGTEYINDVYSPRALSHLINDAIVAGRIPDSWFKDETRPVVIWQTDLNPERFIKRKMESFLDDYARDLQQSQDDHVELLVEKNTIAQIIEPVARKYHLVMTSGRGYTSFPPRVDQKNRFKASGKRRLVVLIVSDFDGEGDDIAHSYGRSMRDDFGLPIVAAKIALRKAQIPAGTPGAPPKEESARTKKFKETHGRLQQVYELEALNPGGLQIIVRPGYRAGAEYEGA